MLLSFSLYPSLTSAVRPAELELTDMKELETQNKAMQRLLRDRLEKIVSGEEGYMDSEADDIQLLLGNRSLSQTSACCGCRVGGKTEQCKCAQDNGYCGSSCKPCGAPADPDPTSVK